MMTDNTASELPVLVSFPRSGSQWLGAVMELYFGRPCLREKKATLLDAERDDYLFRHEHDLALDFEAPSVLYLYRDPVDVLYSWLHYRFNASRRRSLWGRVRQRGERPVTADKVRKEADFLHRHLCRWLLADRPLLTGVRYERLREAPVEEFAKICRHFDARPDPERIVGVFDEVSREKLMDVAVKKVALHQDLLSNDYASGRQAFRDTWGGEIRQRVIRDGLEEKLADYRD